MTVLTRIDEQGCGCGAADDLGDLVSIDEAIARIVRNAGQVAETETVSLASARGRVLAEPVCAISAAPPFDNAAMDGYAINSACLTGEGPWVLPVTHRIAAGQKKLGSVRLGNAAQIFTGAPMPDGADAVVMQEHVQRTEGGIVVLQKVRSYAHVRRTGEDMVAADVVVPADRHLTARDIAACAAAGSVAVRVRRRVRVALLVTGDEVSTPGVTRKTSGIWDVNTPMLRAAIETAAIELVRVETGEDNRAGLRRQLSKLAEGVDLIVSTGGISVGGEDHVKPALADLGLRMAFSGAAIKPGKPVSFGKLGDVHWLGLPGNPLSAFLVWQVFGTVLSRCLSGGKAPHGLRRHVVLSRPLRHTFGRCELRLAELSGFDGMGREVVHFEDSTHSGRVARLPIADGVILIPSEVENLPEGALVEFRPFCD
ncbi:MAG: molybdopterin molybdotransferase MoeA [Sulfitobacter sp.]|nr:molybdopterin molybdotransferase MoeA [Sulfitobacter sp.]